MTRLITCVALLAVLVPGIGRAEEHTTQKPGRVVTSRIKSAAIVEAVNRDTREIKLIDARGRRFSVIADERIRNFDQIEPRDRVVTEYLQSVAVIVAPAGSEPTMRDGAYWAVAPEGEKPAVSGVATSVLVASVVSLNSTDRLATLETKDGTLHTVKVALSVPLHMVEVGDQVRIWVTRSLAVSIVEPDDG